MIKQPLNMAVKFVPLEVSSAGTDAKLVQPANMLLKFVFLAKFNFGIDANAEQPLNNVFASVTFIVSKPWYALLKLRELCKHVADIY